MKSIPVRNLRMSVLPKMRIGPAGICLLDCPENCRIGASPDDSLSSPCLAPFPENGFGGVYSGKQLRGGKFSEPISAGLIIACTWRHSLAEKIPDSCGICCRDLGRWIPDCLCAAEFARERADSVAEAGSDGQ